MLNSPTGGQFSIKSCLLRAFSAAAVATTYKDVHNRPTLNREGYPIEEVLDRINALTARFWTKSLIEDILSKDGTGVSIEIGFLIDFASRFNVLINTEITELKMLSSVPIDDPVSGSEICKKIVEKSISDLENWTRANSKVLIPQGDCEFYAPLEYDAILRDFIDDHSWTVPLYLFFTTGAYSEFREMLKS